MNPSRSDSRADLRLFVNGDPQMLESPCNVANLLESLDMKGRRVAVAVNRNVILRTRYAEVLLAEGDRIEILEAVGGG
jgi:sulfur carrier protein